MIRGFQRVRVRPGKHGPGDYRVELGGIAPTHAETVYMVGAKLIAEDRYAAPGNLGRYFLWRFLDALLTAKSFDDVAAVAADCQSTIDDARDARGATA